MPVSHLSREFEKQTGMHFSEYLRNIRLYRAAGMLRNSDKAVIEIAEACGFFNVNTFTVNFKKMYGTTPSIYKKQQIELDDGWKEETGSQVNYVRLLKYAPMEESIRPLDKKLPDTIVKSDVWREKQERQMEWGHMLSVNSGNAKDYLMQNHKEILQQAVQDIGFEYVFVQGILDDSVNIYHEHLDGTPWYNYTFSDTITDHICSIGARPWIELGHTPEKMLDEKKMIYNDGYIQLPSDLRKWEQLIENVIEHWIGRYGIENVESWRISLFPALFISYGLFSIEEYLEYYRCT